MIADADRSDATRVAVLGGHDPAALQQVIAGVPQGEGIALVIACPTADGELTEKLREGPRPVIVVRGHARVERDRLFVIPHDHIGWFQRSELYTELAPSAPAPFDRLLRTAADELGRDTTGVILAGRGSDGAIGIKRLKEAGGLTIAQKTDGDNAELPRAAIATGMIDLVLHADEIGRRLSQLTREVPAPPETEDPRAMEAPDTLREIISLLRNRTGHDFGSYKRATLHRRLARRMQVCQCATAIEYQAFLHDHPGELANLLRDFLISVTNFFRDPEAFEALARQVVPRMFAGKKAGDQVRVWVPGCATGEEAYSIAILLAEHASTLPAPPQCQVFATDIDDIALSEARTGRYPETIALDVSPARIARFFVPDAGHLRVNDAVRETILFSPHNLLRDPPFSRLDLVSCRNLLIYLNRDAQDRVFNVFHFALRPDGHLFLGSSESAEGSSLFSPLDARFRIFTRRLAPSTLGISPFIAHRRWEQPLPPAPAVARERELSAGQLHYQLLEKYAPPSLLVNEELEVIHVSANAGQFLRIEGGEPTRDLLRLIHPELRVELRSAIHNARHSPHDKAPRLVEIEDGDRKRMIEIRVKVTDLPELGRGGLLVMLEERESAAGITVARAAGDLEPVVHEIEEELRSTREQLRLTIEQYETSGEELKASNEELQAINEELRSATEELETGKEELQSVNEELITLNHELKVKLEELSHANADLQNLMASTEIGVVFLDRALHIKRFTPRVQRLFNVIPSDLGRPFAHLTHKLLGPVDFVALSRSVLETLRTVERELHTQDGRSYLARLLPYRSLEDRIDGVVLTFVEVTDLRAATAAHERSEAALAVSEERLQFALRLAPIVIIAHGPDLEATWGFAHGAELDGAKVFDLFAPGHADRYAVAIQQASTNQSAERAEIDLVIDGQLRTYDFRIEPSEQGVQSIGFDITPSKLAESALVDADRRKDEFLATLSHELRNPLTPLKVALDVTRVAKDPSQIQRSREIMERQVAMLEALVNDLLDLSRVTQGRITLDRQPLGVTELVEAALEVTRPMIAERGHRLQVHLPDTSVVIIGDRTRLIQVLTNLLGNAAKYTPHGGDIELVLAVDSKRKRLMIHVRDTGIGIAPDMLSRIFEIFVQCRDAQGRSQGGLGIGLDLVRRLVALHGGTVSATSDGPDRGSEFVVELPIP